MASVTYGNSLRMNLNDYRGLSAYEIAVQNGFEGSEQEWLDSLKGPPGASADDITVNRQPPVNGNISLTGSDINLSRGSTRTIYEVVDEIARGQNNGMTTDSIVNDLTTGGANKVLSAEMGKQLNTNMPRVFWVSVPIYTNSWNTYNKTANVEVGGVLSNEALCAIQYSPASGSEDAFAEFGLRVTGQGDGTLTFSANIIPTRTINVNVYVTILNE